MAVDLTFEAHRSELARKAAETVSCFVRGPAGKYRPWSVGGSRFEAEPIPCPGCTVLAKPFPIEGGISALLQGWQNTLASRSTAFVPVPPDSFHMTVADLVAGAEYVELRRDGRDAALHQRVQSILATHRFEDRLQGIICGVGAFPISAVAFVDFENSTAYRELLRLRNAIYGDTELSRSGVERRCPFIGHITLGYFESDTPSGIDAALDEIRNAFSPARFSIDEVGLFVFSDMSHYNEAT